MISFKQFLNEAETKELVDFLRKNCQPALGDIIKADKFLWRGMTPRHGYERFMIRDDRDIEVAFAQPRQDREPLNTPKWAHTLIDDFFEEKFGQRLRSSAVFVFKNRVSTMSFGTPHLIIPIGKYDLYWSQSVGDLTSDLFPDLETGSPPDEEDAAQSGLAGGENYWADKNLEKGKREWVEVTREMEKEYILEQLQKFHYKKGPNDEAMKNGHGEIMMVCSRYLAIPTIVKTAKKFDKQEIMSCVYEAFHND